MAERRTGEAWFARWLPDLEPDLTLFWPDRNEIESPTLTVRGVAIDDRGIAKVEFQVGGKVVAEQLPPPRLDSGRAPAQPGHRARAAPRAGAERGAGDRHRRKRPAQERELPDHSAGFASTRPRSSSPRRREPRWGWSGSGLLAQRLRRRRAVRRRFNPYIAGAPVLDDEMFFGREKLTQRMLNVLHHNSLMITGERRIGKTTFLYHLKKVLAADEGGRLPLLPGLHRPAGGSRAGLLPRPDVGGRGGAPALGRHPAGRSASPGSAKTTTGATSATTCSASSRSSRPAPDEKVKLALLIDEVDVLNEYSERVNQRLRSIFMKTFSENLVAVMSGVGVKRTWNSEVSPWYNFFDEIEITAFSREEAEALIKTPVAGVFRYEPEAVERILELSQRKPYLVQKLCIHAVNRMLEEGRTTVRSADVEAARQVVMLRRAARQVDQKAPPSPPRPETCGRLGVPVQAGLGLLMRNPFIAGSWVRGDNFFGRSAILREILEGERHAIWVVGARRLGKTSLLKELEYRVHRRAATPRSSRSTGTSRAAATRAASRSRSSGASRTARRSDARPTSRWKTWRACPWARCSPPWCGGRCAAAGGCCCSWTRPRSS